MGGPCGGDGGHGGSVIIKVDTQLSTLQDISYNKHYRAENGHHGQGKNMHGKKGRDIIINVPPGTVIKNGETEQILKDMTKDSESYTAVKGGNGGFGNARKLQVKLLAPQLGVQNIP